MKLLLCLALLLMVRGGDPFGPQLVLAGPGETEVPLTHPQANPPRGYHPDLRPGDEGPVVLAPFYFLRKKGERVWVERTLVTLRAGNGGPPGAAARDLPELRNLIYALLQSGEPDEILQARIATVLGQHAGEDSQLTVSLSRDILIVR